MYTWFALILALILNQAGEGLACKGCISLDEYNIEKIVPKFKAVLAKFDIAYPYGEKHDVYTKFAEEVANVKELVVAEVGVKDYGEKENQELAKKYGIKSKDELPKIKLFLGNTGKPVDYLNEYTVENIRDFVRDNTDLYLGLPGCVERFDRFAKDFMRSSDKAKKLEEAEAMEKDPKEESSIHTYLLFMKKIIENGADFVKQEYSRLSKIIKEGKVNVKKKQELSQRLNVLHSFKIPKDEL